METAIRKEGSFTDVLVTTDGKTSRATMLHGPVLLKMLRAGWTEGPSGESVLGNRVQLFFKNKPGKSND